MRSGKCGNFKASRDFKKRLVAQRRYVSWYKYECGFVRRYLAWLTWRRADLLGDTTVPQTQIA